MPKREKLPTEFITGKVRINFPRLFEPDEDGKYTCMLIIDKKDKRTVEAFEDAFDAAIEAGIKGKWEGKEPKDLSFVLKDGDKTKDSEEYDGCYYVACKSNNRPAVVYADKVTEIKSKEEMYSGCYVIASLNIYPYKYVDKKKPQLSKKGVSVGLKHIMKVSDGERIGGYAASSAEDDFADVDTSAYEAKPRRRGRDDDDRDERRSSRRGRDDDDRDERRSSRNDTRKKSRYDDDDYDY